MEYAPVIIPTLNRVRHLKRCIDSLSRCTDADKTELYISIDFPPSDNYKEGYKKVVDLILSYDFSSFKNHHIFFQKKNLGAVHNFRFLLGVVTKVSDIVIVTEDDNEFSPNFLCYMNQCLDSFRNDEDVIAICGVNEADYIPEKGSNVIKAKLMPVYGIGYWIKKINAFQKEGADFLMDPKSWSIRNFIKLYIRNPFIFSIYVNSVIATDKGMFWLPDGELVFCDTIYSLYMHISKYTCIVPCLSKSRTFGNDGSGVNMPARDDNGMQEIDMEKIYELKYNRIINYNSHNFKKSRNYLKTGYLSKSVLHAIILLLFLFLSGKNRKFLISFNHKFIRC